MSIFYGDRYVDGSSIQNMATQKISLGDWGIIEGTYTVPQDADLSKVQVFFETDYRATPTEQDLISFFLDEVSMKEVDPQEEDEDQKGCGGSTGKDRRHRNRCLHRGVQGKDRGGQKSL